MTRRDGRSSVRARGRLAAMVAAGALACWPALAAACPQCASRAEGGISQYLALGVFVTFPFAVVAVVMRFIRRGDVDRHMGVPPLYPAGGSAGATRNDAAPASASAVGNDLGTTPSRRSFS